MQELFFAISQLYRRTLAGIEAYSTIPNGFSSRLNSFS